MDINNRFSIDKNGDINVLANIPHAELADLPECVAVVSSEIFPNKELSPQAREGFALMLRAITQFFPNEVEQREMCRLLEGYDTKKGKAKKNRPKSFFADDNTAQA